MLFMQWYDYVIFLFFSLSIWWLVVINFSYWTSLTSSEVNCVWLCYIIIFIYHWILFANILSKTFLSIFMRNTGLWLLFHMTLIWFCHQVNTSFIENKLDVFFSSSIFWKRLCHWYFFKILIEFSSEIIWAWTFFWGVLKNYEFNFLYT